MISKTLISGYNDSGLFPPAAIIPSFSGGLDKNTLHKRASIFENEYSSFERKPGHTYIHLISVAAGEHYGPNSRADFYNGDSYKHTFTEPEKGGPAYVILDGGLNKYHNKTFMEHGHAYTEHFSDQDGAKPQGYIVAAKMNPEMKRGELIIGINSHAWDDDIEKLANGKPMKFSIGALTSSDRCSYCGHVAHTEAEHCDHYKNHKGEITENGSQVYVITDNCIFHDISRVKSPAEKIAFSIKKVASSENADDVLWTAHKPELDAVKGIVKTTGGKKKFDTLYKLAAIEKKIIAEAKAGALDANLKKFFDNRKAIKKTASAEAILREFTDFADQDQMLGALKRNKRILTPSEFIQLIVPEDLKDSCCVYADDVSEKLPGLFGHILHSDCVDSFCEDRTYDGCDRFSPMLSSRIMKSSLGNDCNCNILGGILNSIADDVDLKNNGTTIIINISKPGSSVSDVLADNYARYIVSATEDFSPEELVITMLDNILPAKLM